jgi:cytochrome P450
MCIGMHLAMAEMVALVPALYRRYRTSIKPGFEGKAPGIVSRFEVFSDEMFEHTEEHTCWIRFEKQES